MEIVMESVIVETAFGDFTVYEATVENAMKIIQDIESDIPEEVKNLSKKDGHNFFSKESFVKIINNILTKTNGEKASKTIEVNEEIRNELVLYCFNNKIKTPIDEYNFFKNGNPHDLSFIKNHENYQGAEFINDYMLTDARDYSVIKQNRWKEGAKESAKINYILAFVNRYVHRDVKYHLVNFQKSY